MVVLTRDNSYPANKLVENSYLLPSAGLPFHRNVGHPRPSDFLFPAGSIEQDLDVSGPSFYRRAVITRARSQDDQGSRASGRYPGQKFCIVDRRSGALA